MKHPVLLALLRVRGALALPLPLALGAPAPAHAQTWVPLETGVPAGTPAILEVDPPASDLHQTVLDLHV